MAKATAASAPSALSIRAATTAAKATTTVAPSVPQIDIKTEPVTTSKTKASKTTSSYTGPITKARA